MHPEPTLSASLPLSPTPSPSSSLVVPVSVPLPGPFLIPGPYLIHGLPMQIMEKRQRSAPRPKSPLRSEVVVDADDCEEGEDTKPQANENEEGYPNKEVDNNGTQQKLEQLEDPVVFAASPSAFSSVPLSPLPSTEAVDATNSNARANANTDGESTVKSPYDPFAAYNPMCFEDLGLEDANFGFDIRIVEDKARAAVDWPDTRPRMGASVVRRSRVDGNRANRHRTNAQRKMATAGVAVERADLDGQTLSGPAAPSAPVSTVAPSAPVVGLGLLAPDLAAAIDTNLPVDPAKAPATVVGHTTAVTSDDIDPPKSAEGEPAPEPAMQLMTLESSSSISCLAAPMVPPSIAVSLAGASQSGVSGHPNAGAGHSTNGGGMLPPLLSRSAGTAGGVGAPRGEKAVSATSGVSSLKEAPVQEMCVPTAVMPGPSPTLLRTARHVPSAAAEAEAAVTVAVPTNPIVPVNPITSLALPPSVVEFDYARARDLGELIEVDADERYLGNRMLKNIAAIEKWRHACADADIGTGTDSPGASPRIGWERESGRYLAVERRADQVLADYRDEPVGRRGITLTEPDAATLSAHTSVSVSDVNSSAAVDTSSYDIVDFTSSPSASALKTKKSVEGLGMGLPSEVPGIVVTRVASIPMPPPCLQEEVLTMSTAPGSMNLAAVARGDADVDLHPTADGEHGSSVTMTSEIRGGTRFFEHVPVYAKRHLWRVDEEDQEDLALFDFDEAEELRRLDARVSEMMAARARASSTTAIALPIPRLALGAGVEAGARALGGAWSKFSSMVRASPSSPVVPGAAEKCSAGLEKESRGTRSSCRASEASSSRECLSSSQEQQARRAHATNADETRAALDDVPLSSTSVPVSASPPVASKGHVSAFMSRISLSRSSSSSTPVAPPAHGSARPPSPFSSSGRNSPGFVEHVDAPRGLVLGRMGSAALKRFQMLF